MEFRFNVNELFKQPVVEVTGNLLPQGFTGDRRQLWDTVGKVTEVVNAIGEASAGAQGLTKPITTAERLRNSEHKLYLLIDQNANSGNGAVSGMLKVGKKGLYVFDRDGQHYQVSPPCVLDFYVHESRQRHGLGKQLFEHMLQRETVEPVKMAIDRPSDKFLNFLNKHYNLNTPIKQMNNYVVFDGFFPRRAEPITPIETDTSGTPGKKQSANGLQSFNSPYGRYGAPRPPCSMGQIIHNQSSAVQKTTEPSGLVYNHSAPAVCNPTTQQYYSQNPMTVQSMPNMYNQSQQQQQFAQNQANYYQMQGDNRYQQQNPQEAYSQVNPTAYGDPAKGYAENVPTKPQQLPQNYNQTQQNLSNNMQIHHSTGNIPYNTAQDPARMQYYQNAHQQNSGGHTPHPEQVSSAQMQQQNQATPAQYEQQQQPTSPKQFAQQTLKNAAQMQQNLIQASQMALNQKPPQPPAAQPSSSQVSQYPQQQQQQQQIRYQQLQEQHPQQSGTATPQTVPPREGLVPSQINTAVPPPVNAANYFQNNQNVVAQSSAPGSKAVSAAPSSISNSQLQNYQNPTPQQHQQLQQQQYNVQKEVAPATVNPSTTSNMPTTVTPTQSMHPIPTTAAPYQNYPQQMQPTESAQNVQYNQQPQVKVVPNYNMAPPNAHYSSSQPNVQQYAQSAPSMPPIGTFSQPAMGNHNNNNNYQNPNKIKPDNIQAQYYNTYPEGANVINKSVSDKSVSQQPQYGNVVYRTDDTSPAAARQMSYAEKPYNANEYQTPVLNAGQGSKVPAEHDEMEYGYPPQIRVGTTTPPHALEDKANSSPKLERPRSLSIQLSEDKKDKDEQKNDVQSEVPEVPSDDDQLEKEVEKINVVSARIAHEPKDFFDASDNKSAGKRTPSHLTEQGFFDLKFYHNKLW